MQLGRLDQRQVVEGVLIDLVDRRIVGDRGQVFSEGSESQVWGIGDVHQYGQVVFIGLQRIFYGYCRQLILGQLTSRVGKIDGGDGAFFVLDLHEGHFAGGGGSLFQRQGQLLLVAQ